MKYFYRYAKNVVKRKTVSLFKVKLPKLNALKMSIVPHSPRIKICGITRVEDALCASRCGADAIGLVFYPPSPRAVTSGQAAQIVAVLPPFVSAVGLFVDAAQEEVESILAQVPLEILQFHGEEPPNYCAQFGRPYLKAIRMREDTDLHAAAQIYASARGLLLDTYVKGVQGGTGQTFDWARIPADVPKPLVVAGGLDAANVAGMIAAVRPWGVDVSGGVEAAKGIKDPAEIEAFVAAVAKVSNADARGG